MRRYGGRSLEEAKRFQRTYPRDGEPWKLAEDRRLMRLYTAAIAPDGALHTTWPRSRWWQATAQRFGRTAAAVTNRVQSLLAGQRLAGAKRKKPIPGT